ncbi:MAG: LysM peptidoglycan-binding domain-containing protein [Desulfuromonadaceae bacterium]
MAAAQQKNTVIVYAISDPARNHTHMSIKSTTTANTPRPEPRRWHKSYSKLWRCGFALVVLLIVSSCSTFQGKDAHTPRNEKAPCESCVQGESDAADKSISPEPDKSKTTLEQADLQDEEQSEIKNPGSITVNDYPADKSDDSAAATDREIPSLTSDQASTRSQPEEVIISTPVQTTSAQPVQPPATIIQYTVKGGENLYTIASQPFIYADGMLWPLIYRANRDQIKDPRQIYPGQILNIPRDISEPDKEQARTKAKRSPIFNPAEQLLQNSSEDK